MRRRLAVLIVVAGVVLGGVVSISSPFGVGHVIIRGPIVLLQDAAERVVRALFQRRTSVPAQVSAPRPAVVSVAADVPPARPIMEPSAGAAARLTLVRRGTRRAEHDGHDAADRARGQTRPEGDSSGPERSGALRIAGRDQSGADAVALERAAAPDPNGQQTGDAAAPPSTTSADDGPADVKSPSSGPGVSDARGDDGPRSDEPDHGRGHDDGDHGGGGHGGGGNGDKGRK